MTYVAFVSRILFASVFLVAAFGKARNPAAFARTIRLLGVWSGPSRVIAWLIIVYEAALGVLYVSGIFPLIATIAALLLLALFAGVSISAIVSRQKIPCNCFGEANSSLGNQTLVRSILLAVPVSVYYLGTLSEKSTWWPTTIDTTITLLSLVIAVILLARWLFVVENLVALMHDRRVNTIQNNSARRRAHGILQGVPRVQQEDNA
ncbi:MAG TPA: MauE/DoxX family redox-associated membrane protein [Ktedonobacteraceae bacterium]|nr:MauE/DoxX family redox-associated membrane protein [Ktedonobacteraceae bacterium]